MARRSLLMILLVMFVVFLAGCGHPTTQVFSQTTDGLTATLSTDPSLPTAMEPVTLTLAVNDATTGQPVEGAQVAYDLTMPEMTMPPYQLKPAEEGDGLYHTEATFSMSGDWQIQTTVVHNSQEFSFVFDLSVK
jgi:hypothetical protein